MQRVLARAARATRMKEAKGARARGSRKARKLEEFEIEQQQIPHLHQFRQAKKEARIKRREDWELGPLAPRRDVGADADKYGTLSAYFVSSPPRSRNDRPSMAHLQIGDRVVVIKGRQRGKISEIWRMEEDACRVVLRDLNVVDVSTPTWMTSSGEHQTEDSIMAHNMGIPVEHVRLVYPMKDPKTGEIRDTIIENVDLVDDWYEVDEDDNGRRTRRRKEPEKYRAIRGSKIIIPWPEKGDPPEEVEHPADTLEADVREVTFDAPQLLYAPMPDGVIDELRNKFSKFRTRHTYDYIMAKQAEDAREEARKNLINRMKTPTQQIAEARMRQHAERPKELDEQQLASIGAVIAAAQAKALNKTASAPAKA